MCTPLCGCTHMHTHRRMRSCLARGHVLLPAWLAAGLSLLPPAGYPARVRACELWRCDARSGGAGRSFHPNAFLSFGFVCGPLPRGGLVFRDDPQRTLNRSSVLASPLLGRVLLSECVFRETLRCVFIRSVWSQGVSLRSPTCEACFLRQSYLARSL